MLRQLTYYDNNIGIVYTSYRESANSDTTKANDNVTTFQDHCRSAESWLRGQDCGWGEVGKKFVCGHWFISAGTMFWCLLGKPEQDNGTDVFLPTLKVTSPVLNVGS